MGRAILTICLTHHWKVLLIVIIITCTHVGVTSELLPLWLKHTPCLGHFILFVVRLDQLAIVILEQHLFSNAPGKHCKLLNYRIGKICFELIVSNVISHVQHGDVNKSRLSPP